MSVYAPTDELYSLTVAIELVFLQGGTTALCSKPYLLPAVINLNGTLKLLAFKRND
jgi:hypothetical protein